MLQPTFDAPETLETLLERSRLLKLEAERMRRKSAELQQLIREVEQAAENLQCRQAARADW